MKRIVITALAILFATSLIIAQKQGTVVYENTMNIHKSLGPDQQALKAMIPETTTQNFQFIFNEQYGCFKNAPSDKPKGVMMQMGGGDSKTWFNFGADVYRQYIDLDDELFHTEFPMVASEAKPTGKSKTILDYTCEEYKSDDGKFSFWVAKDFPKKISPMPGLFFNGAVLAIDSDIMNYMAVSISKEIDEKELKPVESQEITQEQFQDLQEEKMNEMKAMNGKVIKMGDL